MGETNSSTTLEKAIALLWALYSEPNGITASALARKLDIHRTVLYRLLRPFQKSQFVRKGDQKKYYLGFGISALARAVSDPIESLARSTMQQLADATMCTAMIVTDTDGTLVTVVSYEPTRPGKYISAPPGYIHNDDSAAKEAISGHRQLQEAEFEVSESDYATTSLGDHVVEVGVPLTLPQIGQLSCILLASPQGINVDQVLPLMRESVRALKV